MIRRLCISLWWLGVATRVVSLMGSVWVIIHREEVVVVTPPGWSPLEWFTLWLVGTTAVTLSLAETLHRGPTGRANWFTRLLGWITAATAAAGVATAVGVLTDRVILRVWVWYLIGRELLASLAAEVNQRGGDATKVTPWDLVTRDPQELAHATAPVTAPVPPPPPGAFKVAMAWAYEHPYLTGAVVAGLVMGVAGFAWWWLNGNGGGGTPPPSPPPSPPSSPPPAPTLLPSPSFEDIEASLNALADYQRDNNVAPVYRDPVPPVNWPSTIPFPPLFVPFFGNFTEETSEEEEEVMTEVTEVDALEDVSEEAMAGALGVAQASPMSRDIILSRVALQEAVANIHRSRYISGTWDEDRINIYRALVLLSRSEFAHANFEQTPAYNLYNAAVRRQQTDFIESLMFRADSLPSEAAHLVRAYYEFNQTFNPHFYRALAGSWNTSPHPELRRLVAANYFNPAQTTTHYRDSFDEAMPYLQDIFTWPVATTLAGVVPDQYRNTLVTSMLTANEAGMVSFDSLVRLPNSVAPADYATFRRWADNAYDMRLFEVMQRLFVLVQTPGTTRATLMRQLYLQFSDTPPLVAHVLDLYVEGSLDENAQQNLAACFDFYARQVVSNYADIFDEVLPQPAPTPDLFDPFS